MKEINIDSLEKMDLEAKYKEFNLLDRGGFGAVYEVLSA